MARRHRRTVGIRLQSPLTTAKLPDPMPPWHVIQRDDGNDGDSVYYVHDSLVAALGLDGDPARLDAAAQAEAPGLQSQARKSGRRTLLLLTIFLPVLLIGSRPFPPRPGSQFTQGMAIVGFLTILSLMGFVAALVLRSWIIAGLCSYWWVGSKALQAEYQYRGFDI